MYVYTCGLVVVNECALRRQCPLARQWEEIQSSYLDDDTMNRAEIVPAGENRDLEIPRRRFLSHLRGHVLQAGRDIKTLLLKSASFF